MDGLADGHTAPLLHLRITPLHNLLHLAFGLTGLALQRTSRGAAAYGFVLSIGYGVVLLNCAGVAALMTAFFAGALWLDTRLSRDRRGP